LRARGPRSVDAPDKTRPASCSSGRGCQLAPDPVLARADSALKASLALGKLYQSTDRLAEADAVLAAALEGFSPTPRCLRSPRRRRWPSVWRSAASDSEGYFVLAMESNGGFGANSGPSRGDRCRRAFRPIATSPAATGNDDCRVELDRHDRQSRRARQQGRLGQGRRARIAAAVPAKLPGSAAI
jgi:hypothetical protein